MKLFNKISLFFVLFTLIIIFTISGYVFESLKNDYQNILLEESSSTVHQKVVHLKTFVSDIMTQSSLIANIPELWYSTSNDGIHIEINHSHLEQRFSTILGSNSDILDVGILGLDGHELIRFESTNNGTIQIPTNQLKDVSDEPYFINAIQKDSQYISDISKRTKLGINSVKTITTVTPIKNFDDQTIAFLEITYDIGTILDEMFESSLGSTVIFDQDGAFILHPYSEQEFGNNSGYNYFVSEPELGQNVKLMDSKKHVDNEAAEFRIWEKVFYDQDDSSRFWVVASVIPQSILFSQINHLQNDLILIISIFIIGTIFVTVLISRHITHPIKELLKGIKRIEKGNFSVEIQKTYGDEIGDLVDSFNLMAQSLNQSKILVDEYDKELEEKIRQITTTKNALDKTLMVSKTDTDGNITYVNDKFCSITEFSRDELIGKNHRILKSGYHPDDFFKQMWDTITNGKTWVGEIKNKTKTGKELWTISTISPSINDDGNIVEFVSLKVDITKRKQAEEKLVVAYNHLKELDRAKNEFSAMVSHELRTPLTPVLTYCDILRESKNPNLSDLEKECVDEINSNVKKLDSLISDILDAQKLEMNKIKFVLEPFSISSLLDEVIRDLTPASEQKGVKLTKGTTINQLLISDRLRLFQVITNLVKNSIDFVSPKSGMIEIGVMPSNSEVEFYVKDNGIGIPKDKISNLFKKFYQIDSGVRRSHGGNGLGLVISKGIVEGLGGTIWVESQVDKGTTFHFTIPLRQKPLVRVKNERVR